MQDTVRDADVAIVGAGITGLAIAERLVRGGSTVVIYEKQGIAAEASGVQPGGIRQQWSTRLTCELAIESVAFYSSLQDNLGILGAPVLERCGYLFVAHDDATMARLRRDVDLHRELGIRSRLLAPEEIDEVIPGLRTDGVLGAAFSGEDGFFDRPQGVVEAFAASALAAGARLEIAKVERIAPNGAGWDLELADGRVAPAERVVVAAGYHTPSLLRPLDYGLPIEPVPKFLFLSAPIPDRLLDPFVVAIDRHFAAKQLADGRVLTSYLAAQGDAASNSLGWRQYVRRCIDELLPILTFVPTGILVEGIYDVTPDNHPIIAPLDDRNSLWVAAGFSGHGFMIAPAIARIVSEALLDGRYDAVLSRLTPDRFEAQAIEPELQIV